MRIHKLEKFRPLVWMGALLAVAAIGCSGNQDGAPDLVKVTGVVTSQGKPVNNVQVLFEPQAEAGASRGKTDEDGKFELYYTLDQAGATPGKHRVQFRLQDEEADPNIVPKKLTIGAEGIPVDVTPEGPNEFQFDLAEK